MSCSVWMQLTSSTIMLSVASSIRRRLMVDLPTPGSPVMRMSKTSGDVTGEALATAEQFGKLGRHIQQVLEEICRELGEGAIAADPFWRGPDKNACRYCDYAAACHFEEGRGGDCRRWAPKIAAADFWSEVSRDGADD